MGELNRAFDAFREGEPGARDRLYATIRARVMDDVLAACGPLLDGLESDGHHTAAAWLREILLRTGDAD